MSKVTSKRPHQKIQKLVEQFDEKGDEVIGIVVYDLDSGEVFASQSFSQDYINKTLEIERAIKVLEQDRILKLDPAGQKNWVMYSYWRKIVVTVRIQASFFLTLEYQPKKAPSAAIEDALEIALMVNEIIG